MLYINIKTCDMQLGTFTKTIDGEFFYIIFMLAFYFKQCKHKIN